MADIRIVSFEEHGSKRWFQPTDFRFAAKDRVVAIGFSELPKAMLSLPLAFIKNEQGYQPAAVQGLFQGQNLLVSSGGQWLADYIPLIYRSLPLRQAKNPNGQFVLCVDHDTGLVSDGPAGNQFFADEKNLSPEVSNIAAQLMQFEADRPRAALVCKLLSEHDVIEPWVLQVQQDDEIHVVDGLFRIKESRLMELAAEVLVELRNCGGLTLCYAQLFSMQHIQQLGNVAKRTHWANGVTAATNKVAPPNIVDDNGILSFANL